MVNSGKNLFNTARQR